ncbi:organic hydroperoxide resistance protein [Lonepinella koalarum]|uniref:Ohr subfamily peroxiredoxin n=1 Tax=Lonepinella koalarum TaxID=53417 RepID=A0A4R1L047_9PAST|nr:organic hydroperoxide resistance protein [Lonepinella koalarum]MDH2926001.1 organic hydroperoxide resistance protein [Lonepinella koalarum]TCK71154.1 Ohr subfamily peroxiredoxin [Lonepinella koalarum]TFJ90881.1 organic hydroperoxide resistance protein [Lonepinella koalarum]TYG34668.1 organic hydroperoxide resistance protein [Lonepinella koalarum]
MKIFYSTSATAVGGRSGHTQLDDGSLGFDLVSFQDKDKTGVNPEQLFAMGYAACFDSAMNLVSGQLGIKPTSAKSKVGVGIGQKPDGTFSLDIDITIEVGGINEQQARELIERTHQVCPYSNAIRGNVETRLHVNLIQSFDL